MGLENQGGARCSVPINRHRFAIAGVLRPATNDRAVSVRYQFIDQGRRRFATLKVRLYGSDWNFQKPEGGAPELGRTGATECLPCKVRQTGLEPLRLIAHAAFQSRGPIALHEIMATVEQQ